MNYYVLFAQTQLCERFVSVLNKNKNIIAFIPKMEVYRRDSSEYVLEVMFPGYVFIKTEMNQLDFDQFLVDLQEQKKGFIKELKREEVSCLTDEEIDFLNNFLDETYILRMSYGTKIGGRSIPYEGPLVKYMNYIKRVNFYRNIAYLDIEFMNRDIMVGFTVKKAD